MGTPFLLPNKREDEETTMEDVKPTIHHPFALRHKMQQTQNSSSGGGSQQRQHLQRGQACITCRRKKMRCDGVRPYCGQCGLTRRPEDCEYTDRPGRTNTEVLEERLSQLKARLQELENPSKRARPVFLHDPYTGAPTLSITSVPSTVGLAPPHLPGTGSPHGSTSKNSSGPSSRLASGQRSVILPSAGPSFQITEQKSQLEVLLATFLPHASRLGFCLNIPSFLASVAKPEGDPMRPHTGLIDVIVLWAFRLASIPDFVLHEPAYIAKALESMPLAVGSTSAVHQLQFVQAEILLAVYFFCDGRLLEGRYHATAAMSSALSYRLHKIGAPPASPSTTMAQLLLVGDSAGMDAARDAIELGERINVFWSAYLLDRCWSVALGSPPSLLDERPPSLSINTPLPRPMDEYAQMDIDQVIQSGQTLCQFMEGAADSSRVGERSTVHLSLVVASALFERATRLMVGINSEMAADPGFLRRVANLEIVFLRFSDALTRGVARQSMAPNALTVEERRIFVAARSVARVAIVQLHNLLSESPSVSGAVRARSHGLCMKAAREVAAIIRELGGDDVGFMNPIIGVAWLSASRILLKELGRLQEAARTNFQLMQEVKRISAEVDLVSGAMSRLGRSCPLFAYQTTAFGGNQF